MIVIIQEAVSKKFENFKLRKLRKKILGKVRGNKMFCEQCGRQLEEGSKFCSGCGSAVGGLGQEIRQFWQNPSYQPQEYIQPIQPNPQMEVAKKQAENAKNIFFSILVKPVSTLEQGIMIAAAILKPGG